MTNIKDKIQEIKLTRMGKEYQFVAQYFSDLVPHKSLKKPEQIYFLKNGIPVMVFDKKTPGYLWCHNDNMWSPLLKIVSDNIIDDTPSYYRSINEMRKIIKHFALGYFNLDVHTASMAHIYITESWKNLKFRRLYSW